MTVRVLTEPVYDPVTLAEAKLWARIDEEDTSQDAVLELLIGTMREYAENLTGRSFIPRQLQLLLPRWPIVTIDGVCRTAIELPHPPLISVDSIVYVDQDGEEQTLATSQYEVHSWREPAVIVPSWDAVWPSVRAVMNAVQVTYTAGYSAVGSPTDEAAYQAGLPKALRTWMKARVATLYENREQVSAVNAVALPRNFVDGLLDHLVVGSRLF